MEKKILLMISLFLFVYNTNSQEQGEKLKNWSGLLKQEFRSDFLEKAIRIYSKPPFPSEDIPSETLGEKFKCLVNEIRKKYPEYEKLPIYLSPEVSCIKCLEQKKRIVDNTLYEPCTFTLEIYIKYLCRIFALEYKIVDSGILINLGKHRLPSTDIH